MKVFIQVSITNLNPIAKQGKRLMALKYIFGLDTGVSLDRSFDQETKLQ